MQIIRPSQGAIRRGTWALALAAVALAGIAVGRWIVPVGDSAASLASTDVSSTANVESVAPDPAAGHVLGVRFGETQPPETAISDVAAAAAPGSAAAGHVLGVRFQQPAQSAAPDSPGEGHVIGITFE